MRDRSSTPADIFFNSILRLTLLFLFLLPGAVQAEPYRPTDDSTVLEKVSANSSADLQALRDAWAVDPTSLPKSIELSKAYLDLNRATGDPRYLGYAEAALSTWWSEASAPLAVLIHRATIRQRRHDFGGALADLDSVLSVQPRHPQALLSKAFVLQSVGAAGDAKPLCKYLPAGGSQLVRETCSARMESLTGRGGSAQRRLRHALAEDINAVPNLRLWALTNLAEIAQRNGSVEVAERAFREALSLDLPDTYLRDAYADFLLDDARPAEVAELFAQDRRPDGHLLRLALALKTLGDPLAMELTRQLADRFDESRRRGSGLHLREAARFELHLREAPAKALQVALENWQQQREPWDARLVLESALAARNAEAASEVLKWLRETKLEDAILNDLQAKLEGVAS